MFTHHQEAINKVIEILKEDKEIIALIFGGSIAHQFAKEDSDVDIMIVVSEEDYQKRVERGYITYFNGEICTYEGGYVDGKYVSIEFMKKVAEIGSEPARFAFKDCFIGFSRDAQVERLIEQIVQYPVHEKEMKMKKFYSQMKGWYWYCNESFKRDQPYLLNYALSNMVLFAGRLILVHNETLFPYHKWFLKVLEDVDNKPEGFIEQIEMTLKHRRKEDIDKLFHMVDSFYEWTDKGTPWNREFVNDNELRWMTGSAAVADL